MAEHQHNRNGVDPSIRHLGHVALATLLWAATFIATRSDWLAGWTSAPARAALVAVGVGGFLPVVFVYAKSIRMQDEFNQRIHLVALGVAFAIVGVISYTVDLLHHAHFIAQPSSVGLWGLLAVVWFLAMLVTPRFYR